MTDCLHTWEQTTSDRYQQCSKCHTICKVKHGIRVQIVRAKATCQSWYEAEKEMLDQARTPDYVDYDKARTDLKNYWR